MCVVATCSYEDDLGHDEGVGGYDAIDLTDLSDDILPVAQPEPLSLFEDVYMWVRSEDHILKIALEPCHHSDHCDQGGHTEEDPTDRDQCDQRDETRSEEHTSELQSRGHLVCRLLHE